MNDSTENLDTKTNSNSLNTQGLLYDITGKLQFSTSLVGMVHKSLDLDNQDEKNSLSYALEKLEECTADIEKIISSNINKTNACPRWFDDDGYLQHDTDFESWNPVLVDFIEQAADRISVASRNFAKDKLIQLVEDRIERSSLTEAIEWLSKCLPSATPIVVGSEELRILKAIYETSRKTLSNFIGTLDQIQNEHKPQEELGFIGKHLRELETS